MYRKEIESVYKRLASVDHMYLIHAQLPFEDASAEVAGTREIMFEEPLFAHEDSRLTMGATYRLGGFSTGVYNQLNLAFHVGDDETVVRKNRALMANYLGVSPGRITTANQVHGLKIVEVTSDLIGAGAFDLASAIPDTDALMTQEKDVPLFLFTADCVAVGIYDPVHQAIATVHAGWKGTIGHLPTKTLDAMHEAYGSRPKDCQIFLGPSIGPLSFEVSEELAENFRQEEALWGMDSVVSYHQRPGADRATPHVDLWAFIVNSLLAAGVPASSVTVSGTDSMTEDLCYSYRREQGKTGRMALFAMLHS